MTTHVRQEHPDVLQTQGQTFLMFAIAVITVLHLIGFNMPSLSFTHSFFHLLSFITFEETCIFGRIYGSEIKELSLHNQELSLPQMSQS